MNVEFMIRYDDLWKFCKLARSKTLPVGEQWNVYLAINGLIGGFSAGGIYAQYPINAVHEGNVQIPLGCLEEVIKEQDSDWADIRCEDGEISCGRKVCCHDSIALECGMEDYLQYPTPLELILLGRLLDEKTCKDSVAGLETRIPAAMARMKSEVWLRNRSWFLASSSFFWTAAVRNCSATRADWARTRAGTEMMPRKLPSRATSGTSW